MVRLKGGGSLVPGMPLGVVVGRGTSMEVDGMQGFVDEETWTVANDDIIILCSHPYPMLASGDGEDDRQGSRALGALFGTVGKADMEEGEVVRPSIGKTVRSGKCSRNMRWFDHSRVELLEEILLIVISFL